MWAPGPHTFERRNLHISKSGAPQRVRPGCDGCARRRPGSRWGHGVGRGAQPLRRRPVRGGRYSPSFPLGSAAGPVQSGSAAVGSSESCEGVWEGVDRPGCFFDFRILPTELATLS
ncbi:hypothetical protein RHCRD62_70090 [Rhodococcus sp. RD6.2]|nr:hypothetical protein RHCRD62_70090 [Rhodococcus sp. RD6.2]